MCAHLCGDDNRIFFQSNTTKVPSGFEVRGRRRKRLTYIRYGYIVHEVSEQFIRRYRKRYAKLLRLYPQAYRERFGESMEQTFNDICNERVKEGKGLFG